jgi:hypothetical protein
VAQRIQNVAPIRPEAAPPLAQSRWAAEVSGDGDGRWLIVAAEFPVQLVDFTGLDPADLHPEVRDLYAALPRGFGSELRYWLSDGDRCHEGSTTSASLGELRERVTGPGDDYELGAWVAVPEDVPGTLPDTIAWAVTAVFRSRRDRRTP